MTFRRPLLFALLPLLATSACADDDSDAAPGDDPVAATGVAVVDNDFEPETIAVDVGDTVTWNWEGSNPHDVVGESFESEVQTSGTFTHAFDVSGEFDYVCTVHPGMNGQVVVQ